MTLREVPLASLENDSYYNNAIHFQLCTEIKVYRHEEDGLGQTLEMTHTYRNEPGIIDVYTPLLWLHDKGPEYIRKASEYIMELLWGKVSPGSGTSEAATILDVKKQRVNQLMNDGKMPVPIAVLAATPMWRTVDVVNFAILRKKPTL